MKLECVCKELLKLQNKLNQYSPVRQEACRRDGRALLPSIEKSAQTQAGLRTY